MPSPCRNGAHLTDHTPDKIRTPLYDTASRALRKTNTLATGEATRRRAPEKLFDLLQFGADLQNTRLRPNAVTCGFDLRESQPTRRARPKLQQIEKFWATGKKAGISHQAEV